MPQKSSRRVLTQTLLGGRNYSCLQITTKVMKEGDLAGSAGDFTILDAFKSTVTPLGLSVGYSSTGRARALAIASMDKCLIVEFSGNVSTATRKKLEEAILCKPEGEKYAFDMEKVSMSLLADFNLHITDAVDIQSAFSEVLEDSRRPIDSIRECLGTDSDVTIHEKNVARTFEHSNYSSKAHELDLAQRAWIACLLPSTDTTTGAFAKVKRINTNSQTNPAINVLAKVVSDTLRLDMMKPTEVSHSFTTVASGSGQVEAKASSYKNKFTSEQDVRMVMETEHGPIVIPGQTSRVHGRSAQIQTGGDHVFENKIVASVTSQGRQGSTRAEIEKSEVILAAVKGGPEKLMKNPWFRNIWCPPEDLTLLSWPEEWCQKNKKSRRPKISSAIILNPSQRRAVQTMLSADSDFLTIIQGPPGTGKTSVIASFVQSAIEAGRNGIWLIAETNVAVKNIAEKLASVNFTAWRLLVSKDFHFDWHEHIYSKVQDNIIRSEEFARLPSRRLDGCQVLLCTLSMLSNKFIGRFISRVPLKTLVVDEASQIQISNFLACFDKFQTTLRKICFIGDDKQLPPYGQENVKGLQSIFEVEHLRKCIVFLDTQYRMPPQLGAFVSTAVYQNQLKSIPGHPVPDDVVACQFFDVPGKEQTKGKSYKNELECETVIQIAQILQDRNLSYKIITPYEPQQSYIEDCLKKTPDLAWEDKCYVVDSFQGNEDDYIIVSLVRSRKQGFLENLRRTNVMLTRCKRGMYIVSSRKFLQGVGASCLAGRLLVHYGERAWTTLEDLRKNFHEDG